MSRISEEIRAQVERECSLPEIPHLQAFLAREGVVYVEFGCGHRQAFSQGNRPAQTAECPACGARLEAACAAAHAAGFERGQRAGREANRG